MRMSKRVRGRCNCSAPSSESNQINNNRPQKRRQDWSLGLWSPWWARPRTQTQVRSLFQKLHPNPPRPPVDGTLISIWFPFRAGKGARSTERLSNNYTATSLGQHAALLELRNWRGWQWLRGGIAGLRLTQCPRWWWRWRWGRMRKGQINQGKTIN